MLTTLHIRNLALVSELTIELQPGYNVITGETGAGKSILIGALNLVLGERADRALIRSGSDSCLVEAVCDISELKQLNAFLEENGLNACENEQLILKRSFSDTGANRQFVNHSPTSLNLLARVGEWLVDIHGPHEHQSLLQPQKQLRILDAFGGLRQARASFTELVRRRVALEAEKSALVVDERTHAQQMDLLRFQADEIAAAGLNAEEENQLMQDFQRASNAAKLLQHVRTAVELLEDSEGSLLSKAGSIGRSLLELQKLDPSAGSLVELHQQAVSALYALPTALAGYGEKVELDPEQLQKLEERINLLQSLKRKYGGTIPEVVAFGLEARRRLETLANRDAELARINAALEEVDADLVETGQELTAARRQLIPKLTKAISRQLTDLGFAQSRFEIALSTAQFEFSSQGFVVPSHGFDSVEFLFAPNLGEPPRPLRAIASSGELARVMLALKTVLAEEDQIPVLIFDEVDANVGGETAHAVGQKLSQISKKRQVLCVTHLAQVAAPASAHFVVMKHVKDGRTSSEIKLLNERERVAELARMLGGQGETARKHAEAMLK